MERGESKKGGAAGEVQRLDRWLWFSRVLKSRTTAAEFVEAGRVRINRVRVVKPSHGVRPGDVLTVTLRGRVQVLKVLAAGTRRGPSVEARQLYQVLSDSQPPRDGPGPLVSSPGKAGRQRARGTR